MIISTASGMQSIVMSMSVWLPACLSVHSQNSKTELYQIFVHVAYGPGSVPLWQSCDTLCISGFVNDVIFSHNGRMVRHVYSWAAIEHDKHNSRDYNQILLNDEDQHGRSLLSTIVQWRFYVGARGGAQTPQILPRPPKFFPE